MSARPDPPPKIMQIALDISVGLKDYLIDRRKEGIVISVPELLRALDYCQAELTETYIDQHPEALKNGI